MKPIPVDLAQVDAERRVRARYVFGQLAKMVGVSLTFASTGGGTRRIWYGPRSAERQDAIQILSDPLPWEDTLPMLVDGRFPDKCMEHRSGSVVFGIDILQIVWELLTCQDERTSPEADEHGRFPAHAYRLQKLGLLGFPVVEAVAEHFRAALCAAALVSAEELERARSWRGHRWALCLTHDVDYVEAKYWTHYLNLTRTALAHALCGKPRLAGRSISRLLNVAQAKEDPFWCFPGWVEMESSHDCRSTFFFRSHRHRLTREGRCYDITASRVRTLLGSLVEGGWEVGLHAGYRTYQRPDRLAAERALMESVTGRPVVANRTHYLRARIPAHWEALEAAGFEMDSTIGSSHVTGYRAGTGAPFVTWESFQRGRKPVLELPLIIMDCALDQKLNGSAGVDGIVAACRPYFQLASRFQSVVTILWHQERLSPIYFPHYARAYAGLLEQASDMGALLTSVSGVAGIWNQR